MRFSKVVGSFVASLLLILSAAGQETTGGLQGTVKDPSGAVVPNAKVVVTTSTLVGEKEVSTNDSGYYRFAKLPPGNYTVTVTASGFEDKTFVFEIDFDVIELIENVLAKNAIDPSVHCVADALHIRY